MNLFVIYIGGSHKQSCIELHDMRFIAAEKIEDTYELLKKTWWGIPESLHLDAWGYLEYADGCDIHLKNYPSIESAHKLYFLNLGGYDDKEFTELHKNIFVVAENETTAKTKALKGILDWKSPHKDYQFDVENVINIENILSDQKIYIHLTPTKNEKKFEFTCKYIPIGKDA